VGNNTSPSFGSLIEINSELISLGKLSFFNVLVYES
jgi:hypothetical protein